VKYSEVGKIRYENGTSLHIQESGTYILLYTTMQYSMAGNHIWSVKVQPWHW